MQEVFHNSSKLLSTKSHVGTGLLLLMSSALPISLSMHTITKRKISIAVKTCHIHLRAQWTQQAHKTDDN